MSKSDALRDAVQVLLEKRDADTVADLRREVAAGERRMRVAQEDLGRVTQDRMAIETVLTVKRQDQTEPGVTLALCVELREVADHEERLRGKLRKLEQDHVGSRDRLARWTLLRSRLP